jgi:hypothetical protein
MKSLVMRKGLTILCALLGFLLLVLTPPRQRFEDLVAWGSVAGRPSGAGG